jgi:hypothetical protein
MVFTGLQGNMQMLPWYGFAVRTVRFLAETGPCIPSAIHSGMSAKNKVTRFKSVANMPSDTRFTVVIYDISDVNPHSELICAHRADLGVIAETLVKVLILRISNSLRQTLIAEFWGIDATHIPPRRTWGNKRLSRPAMPHRRPTSRDKEAVIRSDLRAAMPFLSTMSSLPHRKNRI